jgi:hypothetical protein
VPAPRIGRPICELIDIVSGTSTRGILALGATNMLPTANQALDAVCLTLTVIAADREAQQPGASVR